MAKSKGGKRQSLEAEIENTLCPDSTIPRHMLWDFVEELEAVETKLSAFVKEDPSSAVDLYETFIAGAFEKVEDLDDMETEFDQFVSNLFCGWIEARQAAGIGADETASALLAWMDRDPYGFIYDIAKDAAQAFDKKGLAAFVRQIRKRFDEAAEEPKQGEKSKDKPEHIRRRWGKSLREIYLEKNNLAAYLALAEETGITAEDCLSIASLLKRRGKREEALAWVERGLVAEKMPGKGYSSVELTKLKYELLAKLGRNDELLDAAWNEYHEHPNRFDYDDLMKAVPKDQRKAWHDKAIDAAIESGASDLDETIELLLVAKEAGKLAELLGRIADDDLEGLSHHYTEPAAEALEMAYPGVAARLWRAQGMRIIIAAKSKYYVAAIENFERAKVCYAKAGLNEEWERLVILVRADHFRKKSFMADFEATIAGKRLADEPSFIERARSRWIDGAEGGKE